MRGNTHNAGSVYVQTIKTKEQEKKDKKECLNHLNFCAYISALDVSRFCFASSFLLFYTRPPLIVIIIGSRHFYLATNSIYNSIYQLFELEYNCIFVNDRFYFGHSPKIHRIRFLKKIILCSFGLNRMKSKHETHVRLTCESVD